MNCIFFVRMFVRFIFNKCGVGGSLDGGLYFMYIIFNVVNEVGK